MRVKCVSKSLEETWEGRQISMVADKMKIQDQIDHIKRFVTYLESVKDISVADLKRDFEKQCAVLYALQLSIEGMITIATHIVSADRIGIPENYSHVFDLLEQAEVCTSEQADIFKKMVRFRNRLVHMYWEVDFSEVSAILKRHLADFNVFLACVHTYLSL